MKTPPKSNGKVCLFVTREEIKLLEAAIHGKMEELKDASGILNRIPGPANAYIQAATMDYEDLLSRMNKATGGK